MNRYQPRISSASAVRVCQRKKRFESGFLNPKVCAFCGKKFVPKRIDSTCCSRKCSQQMSKQKMRG